MSILLMIFCIADVLPKMVCLIVDLPTVSLPNDCMHIIANLTQPDPTSPPKPFPLPKPSGTRFGWVSWGK